METQAELEIGIGNTEQEKKTLEPKKVKIVKVTIVEIEKAKKAEKVNCEVKHPDSEDTIVISSVSYLVGRNVLTRGLWLNKDKDGKIQKGSSLAVFLNKVEAKNLKQVEGKEVETELDEKGYLCFKAY